MRQSVRVAVAVVIVVVIAGVLVGCAVNPIEELSRKIESPRTTTREQAIVDLANLKGRRVVELLIDALAGDEELYDDAAVALVKQGRQVRAGGAENPVVEEVSEIVKKAYVPEPFRARAIWTLGEIGDRRAVPLLQGISLSPDVTKPIMMQQVTEALEKLGFYSEGRSYELPMGTLAGDIDVIPEIRDMKPPA